MAYQWIVPGRSGDIYVKALGVGTEPLRLTEHSANDVWPEWSPDRRRIAFVRELEGRASIYSVPSLGGQERKLVDVRGPLRLLGNHLVVPS